jgi:hypothetical protein
VSSITQVLAAAAGAGPFFVLENEDPPTTTGEAPAWWPFTRLVGEHPDERGDLLPRRIAAVTEVIAGRAGVTPDQIDPRAAASLVHLGLAARLVSPPLAAAILGGGLLHLDVRSLHWRDVLGPVPLTQPGITATPVEADDTATIAAATVDALATGPVAALTAAIAGTGVSRRVLWGNVASSFAAAAGGLVRVAPDRARVVAAVVDAVLAEAPLYGHGAYTAARTFKRSNCCLYYRVPGGGYCGDCVLAD